MPSSQNNKLKRNGQDLALLSFLIKGENGGEWEGKGEDGGE